MLMQRNLLGTILSLVLLANTALAQSEVTVQNSPSATPAVTASSSNEGVRFASPAQALQMRVAIYNASGEVVFDSGLRAGSVIDWKTSDATQALLDGSYLCVVTVKDVQGKSRQRLGVVTLQSGQLAVKRWRQDDVTAAQSQVLATVRQSQKIDATVDGESLTVLSERNERAATVAAHDGADGQVTSTSGALTFRTGDFFSGKDKEQMRITPEGQVGIGTNKPEATLDVAGTIRARGGIVFDDGTVLTSAQNPGARSVVLSGEGSPADVTANAVGGTGTQNRLSKWLDATGTLGNSSIAEVNGLTIFGQAAPIFPTAPDYHTVEIVAAGAKTPLTIVGGSGTVELWKDAAGPNNFPTKAAAFGLARPGNNKTDDMVFSVYPGSGEWIERMRMTHAGNFGIGVAAPAQRLEVAGNVKLNGTGSGIIFPDGSKLTSANGGGGSGGGSMSGTNIIAAINDPTTAGIIGDNRISGNIARLGGANLWTGANTFGAGLSANNAAIVNVGNPVNAGDATNKGYVDSNFVKFVPGTEQLSVGDANGTATMINLRGGSTCCSGPGGHTPAWFKVFQNGSFVATGNLGIGVSPMQGKGYRTSWDSYKGAFRSGYADNEWDDATVGFFSWAGGSNSTAEGLYALAFGDTNFARSTSSIAFGSGNEVKGAAGFSAGAGNRVCDTYGVALGNNAKSGGPLINGKCDPETFNIRGLAAVAIGYNVTADQDHTTAMGKFATNNGFQGTFIWSDGSAQASADTFRNTANNEFAARASGGFRFRTNLTGTTGCNLPAGSGVFNCTSSRSTKENFILTNGEDILARLRKVPVSTWNYINEGQQVRHIGPMAEDFHQAFGLGTNNISIGVQDLAGVSLAAVKALELRTAQLQEKTGEVDKLRAELNELRSANASMEQRLAALEQLLKANADALQNQKR